MLKKKVNEFLNQRKGKWNAILTLGNRTYDGKYTDLKVKWKNIEFRIQTASNKKDFIALITPLIVPNNSYLIIIESSFLWDKQGVISMKDGELITKVNNQDFHIGSTSPQSYLSSSYKKPDLYLEINQQIGLYAGQKQTLEEINGIINFNCKQRIKDSEKYEDLAEVYDAVQGSLAWNTIYDNENKRVITPVSRLWSKDWGGWVLFEWDTYFAAYMASLDHRELSYANAIEITKAITPDGFIPNFSSAREDSLDRSQPPVGSIIIYELYQRYEEKWLLEEVYDELLEWNNWWDKNRTNKEYLSWGSNFIQGKNGTNTWQAALYESGLDNSPMYDKVSFNKETHLLEIADVGLMSLYIADCEALLEISIVLNKEQNISKLKERSNKYKKALSTLWDENSGIYLNLNTESNEKSYKLSPTLFYPLIAKVPSQEQAERMIKHHLLNENEFFGEWIIPSISKNDISFKKQNYWRGRIWGPMNLLVYLGIINYDLPTAREAIIERSKKLLLNEFQKKKHIHENYNAITGEGDDVRSSQPYYHWGALLGFISFIEKYYKKKKI